jgi:hypothetical protein
LRGQPRIATHCGVGKDETGYARAEPALEAHKVVIEVFRIG